VSKFVRPLQGKVAKEINNVERTNDELLAADIKVLEKLNQNIK